MKIYVYSPRREVELDVEYDEKQGERMLFDTCDTDIQADVDNLIEELIYASDFAELNELYKYLQEVSQGEITLESYLTGVTNVLDDLRM